MKTKTESKIFWEANGFRGKSALNHLSHVFRENTEKNLSNKIYITRLDLYKKNEDLVYKGMNHLKTYRKFFYDFEMFLSGNKKGVLSPKDIYKKYLDFYNSLSKYKSAKTKFLKEFVFTYDFSQVFYNALRNIYGSDEETIGNLKFEDIDKDEIAAEMDKEIQRWFKDMVWFTKNKLFNNQKVIESLTFFVLHIDEHHVHMHVIFPSVLLTMNQFQLDRHYRYYYNVLHEYYIEKGYVIVDETDIFNRKKIPIGEYHVAEELGFSHAEINLILYLAKNIEDSISDLIKDFILGLDTENVFQQDMKDVNFESFIKQFTYAFADRLKVKTSWVILAHLKNSYEDLYTKFIQLLDNRFKNGKFSVLNRYKEFIEYFKKKAGVWTDYIDYALVKETKDSELEEDLALIGDDEIEVTRYIE